MGLPVVAGAQLMCPFGTAPSALVVMPDKRLVMQGRPVANINDHVPFLNVLPFGLCTSLMNPVTASQTAAALGVLTPGPCTPVLPFPWIPGTPTALSGPAPTVDHNCSCMCMYGGKISVVNPGTTTVMIG
jgi:hypothetical protein